MALYFLRKEGIPRASNQQKDGSRTLSWVFLVAALLIVISSFLAATGSESVSHHLTSILLPKRYLPPSPKVILLALDKDPQGFDPLDVAMALRGLGKLHPARVIINGKVSTKSDSLALLDAVRQRLRDDGIGLIEGASEGSESVWRPVPLALYNPPRSWGMGSPLPAISGRTAPEAKTSFLPPKQEGITASIPLFATTDSGEIAGSIWWEAIKPRKGTGPTWLLGGKLLLFPNHSPLRISEGGITTYSKTSATLVPMDLFLLRIEEKERGTFSPDFEALWDQATVVLGSTNDVQVTGSLQIILRSIFLGRLSLASQVLLTVLLLALLWTTRTLPWQKHLTLGAAILVTALGSGAAALHHSIQIPLLTLLITSFSLFVSSLPLFRRRDH